MSAGRSPATGVVEDGGPVAAARLASTVGVEQGEAPTCGTQYLCFCASLSRVKNITVTVPDEIYREARIRAAESGTSVSALVSEYLSSLSSRSAEFKRLELQQKRIQDEIEQFRAGDRIGRDELHERAIR